jgi:hypothetical protein
MYTSTHSSHRHRLEIVASLTLWSLYPRYTLYRRLGGAQISSAEHGEERSIAPTGIRTPNHSGHAA